MNYRNTLCKKKRNWKKSINLPAPAVPFPLFRRPASCAKKIQSRRRSLHPVSSSRSIQCRCTAVHCSVISSHYCRSSILALVCRKFEYVKLEISVLGFFSSPLVCLVSVLLWITGFSSAVLVSCFVSAPIAASPVPVLLAACLRFLVRFVYPVPLQLVACSASSALLFVYFSALYRGHFSFA